MNNPKQQVSIDFDKATDVVCEKCGCNRFKSAFLLKRISALVSPTGEETIIPMAVFACVECDHINDEFLN